MNILQHKIQKITNEYQHNIDHFKRMVNESPHIKTLARQMLLSNNLANVFGCGLSGYSISWFDDPFDKLNFITHFISYDILDDGSPVLGWYKWNYNTTWVECDKNDDGAQPFIRCNEYSESQKNVFIREEKALWVINWHEEEEKNRARMWGELDEKYDIAPPNQMFVDLVNELDL